MFSRSAQKVGGESCDIYVESERERKGEREKEGGREGGRENVELPGTL